MIHDHVAQRLVRSAEHLDALDAVRLALLGLASDGVAVRTKQVVARACLPRHRGYVVVDGRGERCAVDVDRASVAHRLDLGDGAVGERGLSGGRASVAVRSAVQRGADEEVVGSRLRQQHAVHARLGLEDLVLVGVVGAAAEALEVLRGVLEHEHELDVEVVGDRAASVASALLLAVADSGVVRAELERVDLAGVAVGDVVGIAPREIGREDEERSLGAVGVLLARQRPHALVLGVGIEQTLVSVAARDAVVAGAGHDPDVAVGAVGPEAAVALHRRAVELAAAVDRAVDGEVLEGVELGVVVAARRGVGGGLAHEADVVARLDALGVVRVGVLGDVDAVHLAVTAQAEPLAEVVVLALGAVVVRRDGHGARRGLVHLGDEVDGIAERHDLVYLYCHSFSFTGRIPCRRRSRSPPG